MRTSLSLRNHCLTRPGLTVVEVLFAMVIILGGLVGVAAMIPYAGRQAEESYKITQALAAGDSALAQFNSSSVLRPRSDAPWLYISEQGSRFATPSLNQFYVNEYNSRLLPPFTFPATPLAQAVLQNNVIGMGICIDPLFWGYQTTLAGSGNFAKTRFPFYTDVMPNSYDPLGGGGTFFTPRLRRISLYDPSSPISSPTVPPRWLRLPAAIQLATVGGGDLIQAKPEVDRSSAPLRGEYIDSTGALIQSPTSASSVSWLATLTPVDETPVIHRELLTGPPTSLAPFVFAPENFNLAVVVFSKRDVRDLNLDPVAGIAATGILPASERIGFLNGAGGAPLSEWNAGSFDITIEADSKFDSRIKIGDWLMLSRTTTVQVNQQIPSAFADSFRQRHKWYRVIGVNGDSSFPREVRVAGEPWSWTRHEQNILAGGRPGPPLAWPTTAVTLLKNVIQVHERTVNLSLD